MIVIACSSCRLTLRVMGDADEVELLVGRASDFWPNAYQCPNCMAKAEARYEDEFTPGDLEARGIKDLTPVEALAALHGLGFPDEQQCTRDYLESLLRTMPVRRIGAANIEGSRRCYLHHLELWDGTKVYLGAGAGGAVVYRIAPPHSYAAKVAHEHAE